MKILVATDGSEFGDAAVQMACRLAEHKKGVMIRVISVYEALGTVAGEGMAAMPACSRELIDNLSVVATQVADRALHVVQQKCPTAKLSKAVSMGNPPVAILDEARAWKADLIVIGSHGLRFWQRAVLGSVSDSVVHHAPCSVAIAKIKTKQPHS